MEDKKEIENFTKRYIIPHLDKSGNLICICNSKNENDCIEAISALIKSEKLDKEFGRPDGYFYDSSSNTLYVFEHFEFDCSPNEEWGSKLRRNINVADKNVKQEMENSKSKDYNSIKVIEQGYSVQSDKKITYCVGQNGDKYRNNYIDNFKKVYSNHEKNLTEYIENCKKQICSTPSKIITSFVIEDITLGGTYYKNGTGYGECVDLLKTKQFLEIFKKSNIDFVFFGMLSTTYLSLCDRTIIDNSYDFIDLDKKEFFVLPAMFKITSSIKK